MVGPPTSLSGASIDEARDRLSVDSPLSLATAVWTISTFELGAHFYLIVYSKLVRLLLLRLVMIVVF